MTLTKNHSLGLVVVRLLLGTSALLVSHRACAQNFISNSHLHAFGGGVYADIRYHSEGMSNPGTAGLHVTASELSFTIEYDAQKRPLRIASKTDEALVEACKDDWCKEDPKAFTLVFKKIGGDVFRKTTFACLAGDPGPRVVMRSVYLGEDVHEGEPEKHGEVSRSEMYSPSKGTGILMNGTEKDGKFVPQTRNTRVEASNKPDHLQIRLIDETPAGDGKWEVQSDVLTEYKKIEYQMEKVREVQYPDGEALTETWEYYARGEITGPDGKRADMPRLKRHKQPDGAEVFHQYMNDGAIEEWKRPNQPVQRRTNLWDKVEKIETRIEETGDRETRRTLIRFEPSRTKTITRVPGEDDRVLIEEFYPSGKLFGGKTRRVIHPDGEIDTYEYSQLEDASIKLVHESGKGDGERVVQGSRRITIHSERGNLLETKTETIGKAKAGE